MRGSGDVRAFCIERGYVLAFDKASLVVFGRCEGYNLLLEKRRGRRGMGNSNMQLPQRRAFPGKKLQSVVL